MPKNPPLREVSESTVSPGLAAEAVPLKLNPPVRLQCRFGGNYLTLAQIYFCKMVFKAECVHFCLSYKQSPENPFTKTYILKHTYILKLKLEK